MNVITGACIGVIYFSTHTWEYITPCYPLLKSYWTTDCMSAIDNALNRNTLHLYWSIIWVLPPARPRLSPVRRHCPDSLSPGFSPPSPSLGLEDNGPLWQRGTPSPTFRAGLPHLNRSFEPPTGFSLREPRSAISSGFYFSVGGSSVYI